ncbi:hypothetical protein EDD69_107115 [Thermolongibacillus altinsuensis]|uniref:Uncharacterized protein n=1 Tax=Thermolongibacillus altinsuensis TaxID=575256 RepID=A0A4R1QDG7_9BACL|nr:hypothetical protein [Thermolongibacillus altinsuensis]TCL49292.1 hypothetical protein EDD69_107115 [Thermolongibacillus altinsuensis]
MIRDYYHLCCRYRGRSVEIRDRFGRIHRGIIDRVTPSHVYIRPIRARGPRSFGGFGFGFFGFGAAAFAIAIGAIVALSLIPFWFFW